MRKKVTQFIVLSLIILFVPSCMSTNFGFHIQESSRDQFVRIIQRAHVSICTDEGCVTNPLKSSGSGAVVSESTKGSYILTAGHVCELEIDKIVQSPEMLDMIKAIEVNMSIVNLSQSSYRAEIVAIDNNSDLCLLFSKNYWNEKGPAKIAESPVFEGERVYNVAAPVGIFYENVVPLLEGFYMGRDGLRAYYSIPAMGGSSGSPVYNIRGHIVGMIHSVNVAFPMVSVSPTQKELKKFLKSNIEAHKKDLAYIDKKIQTNKTRSVEPFWKFLGLNNI
jgi:S1-C subfamily serine protease